jgi:hypothetical protein
MYPWLGSLFFHDKRRQFRRCALFSGALFLTELGGMDEFEPVSG